jgi:hypothetical protein
VGVYPSRRHINKISFVHGSFGDWLLQEHTIWGITVQNWMGAFLIYAALLMLCAWLMSRR